MLGNEIMKGILLLMGVTVEVGDCKRKEDRILGEVNSTKWLEFQKYCLYGY